MMNQIEMYLLGKLIDMATGPEAKRFLLTELKSLETAQTNPIMKAVLSGIEAFLAA